MLHDGLLGAGQWRVCLHLLVLLLASLAAVRLQLGLAIMLTHLPCPAPSCGCLQVPSIQPALFCFSCSATGCNSSPCQTTSAAASVLIPKVPMPVAAADLSAQQRRPLFSLMSQPTLIHWHPDFQMVEPCMYD
jgi:hypothetical protein